MRIIDADELKSKKEYSTERHEWIVPVVQCRECKWYEHPGCWLFNAIRANIDDAPKETDFCSYGEQRVEEVDTQRR